VLLIAAILLFSTTILSIAVIVPRDNRLNHVSGTWIALALDTVEGIFYRPLLSECGYGGTRFMPLYFLLNAMLARFLGINVIASGYVVSVASAIGLLSGVWLFLRRMGLSTWYALSCSALILASNATQLAVATVRGDLLSTALNTGGVALCLRVVKRDSSVPILLASLFFSAAFTTKLTALYAFGAGVAWLFLNGHTREAVKLTLATLGSLLLISAVIHLASGGNALESMLECSTGGMFSGFLMLGPLRLLQELVRNGSFTLLLLGMLLFSLDTFSPLKLWRQFPFALLASAVLVSCLIFGSPGTGYNHLLDLHVAAVLCICQQVQNKRIPRSGLMFIAVAAMVSCGQTSSTLIETYRGTNHRAAVEHVVARLPVRDRIILSDDPVVPIRAGQRPYVLDSWMLRHVASKREGFIEPLLSAIRSQRFGAVVLMEDPRTSSGKRWYETHFGRAFTKELLIHYVASFSDGGYIVFLPKGTERQTID